MTFEEKVLCAFDEIPVPERLSPDNIEAMLRSNRLSAKAKSAKAKALVPVTADSHITVTRNVSRRDVTVKIFAAVAACFVLLTGVLIYRGGVIETPGMDDIIKYADIPAPTVPSNYSELYEVYTTLQLDKTAAADTYAAGTTKSDFTLGDTDIVKTDGGMIYTLWSGTLYIIDPEKSEIVGSVFSAAHPPVEMYIDSGNLFLISNADNSSASSLSVEVYDVTDASNPEKISEYSQCGIFTSGKIVDGRLVLVSSYADYRTAALEGETDYGGFVPKITVNGVSEYVDANSIFVPANASSTDYTVISAIDCKNPGEISVKAILGSGGDAYCTAGNLYVYGKGQTDFTIISKFDLTGNNFTYAGSRSLDGLIPGRSFLSEDDNGLRVITTGFDDDGLISQNVYLLDNNMEVKDTLGAILPNENISRVQFTDGFVFFYTNASEMPAFVVNTDTSITAVPELTAVKGNVYSFKDELLSFSYSNAESGFTLSLYDTAGTLLNTVSFANDEGKVFSSAETDPRAVYIDSDGYIGIPVYSFDDFGTRSSYFIFRITGDTITEQTVLQYLDIDDANVFERAIKTDGNIIVIGGGRIVEVRMSDWKVLSATDYFTR
jgi:hypothetical protein